MFRQIKDLGQEKLVPDNTDIIPIQEEDGTTRHIQRSNFLSGLQAIGGADSQFIQILETQVSGTEGGNATAGAWTKRKLNNIRSDETALVTISNNEFTLPAGIYNFNLLSPFYRTATTRIRLRNISDNAIIATSISIYPGAGVDIQCLAELQGKFTIAANKSLAIEYRAFRNQDSASLGLSSGWGIEEIFTVINLFKVG
ncbi:MAG: hypothetical protein RMZ42_32980 [Nostoc sp. DedQUE05]|uniref:hypothetical protein n=1 Tax=Nostoc sp. DedQUE05 TaxID=3075391 RepID=UPI002AD2815B|nr:hypothetical protein [Nostoc sp. DedQUE05]MDZ8096716.1 hypothetical protein [Nostoc sp. DedQUE05]